MGGSLNFDLSEEQRLLRDLVERFVQERYDPTRRLEYVREAKGFSAEAWRLLAGMGVLAFALPEDWGGLGGSDVALITVMEALGRAVATEPVLPCVIMGGGLIASAGNAEQKARLLPAMAAGEAFVALAHFEQRSRFNEEHVGTVARQAGDATVLSGSKQCVLAGGFADHFILSAVDDNGQAGLYLVPGDAQGLTRSAYRLVDGSIAADIVLDCVAAELMPGGLDALRDCLVNARLAIGAELVGLMTTMFEATLDYAKTRRQFGQPIGSFQVIQHRLADLYTLSELSRSQLYRAAGQAPGTTARAKAVAAAKAYISASATTIGEASVQLHGGIGTTEELMVGQAFKRMTLLASLLGDSNWERRRYAGMDASGE
jgi:alkylation response protein AidB-like acyl-CoA dehydrogenase